MATMYYRPYTSDLQEDDDPDLPGENAMETILPEYQYIFRAPPLKSSTQPTSQTLVVHPQQTYELPGSDVAVVSRSNAYGGGGGGDVSHMEEMERYRLAIRRMGADILSLRDRIKEVEIENSQLRHHEKYEQQVRHAPGQQERDSDFRRYGKKENNVDLSRMNREELVELCESLLRKQDKFQHSLTEYRDQVQKLQNQLIRKNANEEEYLKLGKAHQEQNSILQRMQQKIQKINKLEETVRQQELIIAKMEEVLEKKNRSNPSRGPPAARKPSLPPLKEVETPRTSQEITMSGQESINAALVQENRRLRVELQKARESHEKPGLDEAERMELYQLLDKAEARIISLERQLSDSARKWGREKEELLLKSYEAAHGINPTVKISFHGKIN